MNDQYYRKSNSKKGIPQGLKTFLKNKKLFWSLVVFCILSGIVTFSEKGLLERYHLQKQNSEMKALIAQARQDSIALQKQSADLDTSNFAKEKVAREKYGMVREGETVYKQKK